MLLSSILLLLAARKTLAEESLLIPGQYIIRVPEQILPTEGGSDEGPDINSQLEAIGVQPIASTASNTILVNASEDAISMLPRGSQVYPRMKLKMAAIQQSAPWHLVVST